MGQGNRGGAWARIQEEPVAREYWEVELEIGAVFRMYRDRRRGNWFADGVYD